MTKQLEAEKVKLLEKKRQEQEERQRKQLELERILEDNRRLVCSRTLNFYYEACHALLITVTTLDSSIYLWLLLHHHPASNC